MNHDGIPSNQRPKLIHICRTTVPNNDSNTYGVTISECGAARWMKTQGQWHEFRTMGDLYVMKDKRRVYGWKKHRGREIMRRKIKQQRGLSLAEQPMPPIFELGPPVPFPTFCARSCAYPHLTSTNLYLARPRRGLLTSLEVG